MILRLYCPSDRAILLLALQGSTYTFLSDVNVLPGWHFTPKPLQPIYEQLINCAQAHLPHLSPQTIEIIDDFEESVENSTLYLAKVTHTGGVSLPILMRGMPKNRNRLAYLKAWQFLLGTHLDTLEAIEHKKEKT
jgi:hypothetical protein